MGGCVITHQWRPGDDILIGEAGNDVLVGGAYCDVANKPDQQRAGQSAQ